MTLNLKMNMMMNMVFICFMLQLHPFYFNIFFSFYILFLEDEIIVAENLSEEQQDEAEEPSNPKKITFEEEKEGKDKNKKSKPIPFIGNSKSLEKDEFLDFENKAYEMLHRANTEWPCLSFDTIIPEYESYDFKATKPVEMNSYPYTLYLVSGTQ